MSFVSSLFGGGTQKTESSSSSQPWAPQQPYLTSGFQDAQNTLNNSLASGPFTGSFYSPINDSQIGAANQANAYATGQGAALPNTTANTAQTLQGAASPFLQNAGAIAGGQTGVNPALQGVLNGYATGRIQAGGQSAPLSQALEAAGVSGANAIQAGQGNLQAAAQGALANPTQNTINNAQSYANSPYLDSQIRAANLGTQQTLSEQTLPGLNRAATMGGNLNSSRAGMAEATANRDAANTMANTEATMRGNAYNNGLSLAAQQGEAGTNAAIAAGSAQANSGANAGLGVGAQQQQAGQFGTTTQLGAAQSGITSALANANTQLGANAQLGSGAGLGVNAATAAGTQAGQNYALGSTAGGALQADQNAQLQNAYQQWQAKNGSYQQGLLNNYMQEVGGNYGGTTQSQGSTTAPSNVLGGIAGLGLGAASLFGTGGLGAGLFSGVGSGIGNLMNGFSFGGIPGAGVMSGLSNQAALNVANGAAGL